MKVEFSFLGDISFNDDYIKQYNQNINPFKSLKSVFEGKDFIVGNLECMAKGEQGENIAKKPRLTTTVETLNYLNQIPVNIVSLAHNHIYDHLEDGFNKTTAFLKKNRIQYLGASNSLEGANEPLIIEKKNIKIGLLNYVTKDTNPNVPEEAGVFVNLFELDKVINDIEIIKNKVNHVVISLHWGGRVEGGLYPDWDQPKIGRQLIDAGADLIIGHHPHTIQPFEQYKNKYIFYSLGNFCFSDYVFEGKYNPMPKRRMITPIVNIEFEKENYKVAIKYFKNELEYFTALNYSDVMKRRNRIFSLIKNNKWIWNIYFLYKQQILPFVLFFRRQDLSFKVKLQRIFKSIFNKIK